jgi:hypothetical protein
MSVSQYSSQDSFCLEDVLYDELISYCYWMRIFLAGEHFTILLDELTALARRSKVRQEWLDHYWIESNIKKTSFYNLNMPLFFSSKDREKKNRDRIVRDTISLVIWTILLLLLLFFLQSQYASFLFLQ